MLELKGDPEATNSGAAKRSSRRGFLGVIAGIGTGAAILPATASAQKSASEDPGYFGVVTATSADKLSFTAAESGRALTVVTTPNIEIGAGIREGAGPGLAAFEVGERISVIGTLDEATGVIAATRLVSVWDVYEDVKVSGPARDRVLTTTAGEVRLPAGGPIAPGDIGDGVIAKPIRGAGEVAEGERVWLAVRRSASGPVAVVGGVRPRGKRARKSRNR